MCLDTGSWDRGAHSRERYLEPSCGWKSCLPAGHPFSCTAARPPDPTWETVGSPPMSTLSTNSMRKWTCKFRKWTSPSGEVQSRWQNRMPWRMRLEGPPQGGQILNSCPSLETSWRRSQSITVSRNPSCLPFVKKRLRRKKPIQV